MNRSIRRPVKSAKAEDKRLRNMMAGDSFTNFAAKMGVGADNLSTGGTYSFNPITRVRTLLEWIHRGSWLGGVAVDVVADDMTRAGISLEGDIKPDKISDINEAAVALGIWNKLNETVKWSRLYGGCLAVMLIDGQDTATPLRIETVGKNQFKGLFVLDRWMVEPDLTNVVSAFGPYLGLPKWYRVSAMVPGLAGRRIHYTRLIRLTGTVLPYWQSMTENLWGLSVYERLYDRMLAFDSATQGAAQLVYKAYIRTYKIKGLREVIAAGGAGLEGLTKYVDMMRRFQSVEGVTLLDGEDEFDAHTHAAFGGLGDALVQFGQQLSGALQIPLVRLFGQSPAGLNATGESDLRTYYDGIAQQQVSTLKVPVTLVYRALAQSIGIKLPDGFSINFNPLWQLTQTEKGSHGQTVTQTVTTAVESGLVSQQTALKELKQASSVSGVWSNITDEEIEAAEAELPPGPAEQAEQAQELAEQGAEGDDEPGTPGAKAKKKVKDIGLAVRAYLGAMGIEVVVENEKGTQRTGRGWSVTMPEAYGYIRGVTGADGDQLDCFIGTDARAKAVYIVNQRKYLTDVFDEHKVMLCFASLQEARQTFVTAYNIAGEERIISIREMNYTQFKDWMSSGDLGRPA